VAEEMWHASQVLSKYYYCTVESVLTSCITAWYGNCSVHDRKALQRVVKKVQYITVVVFPPIQDITQNGARGSPIAPSRTQPQAVHSLTIGLI
jgi:quinolinate synthase